MRKGPLAAIQAFRNPRDLMLLPEDVDRGAHQFGLIIDQIREDARPRTVEVRGQEGASDG